MSSYQQKNSQKYLGHQRGFSAISVVIGLAVMAVVITVLLKMTPHYMNDFTLQHIIESAHGQKQLSSVPSMFEYVNNGLKRESLNALKSDEIMSIAKTPDGFEVLVNYAKQEKLVGNLDLSAHFQKIYHVRTQ